MKPRMPLLALAASMLLLAGCASAAAPPPGLTDDQLDALTQRDLDGRWDALRMPIPKPEVQRVQYTTSDNWSMTQVACLIDQGLDAHEVSGGFAVDGFQPGNAAASDPYAISVAMWTCLAEYPRDVRSSGYLSDAQVLYMYDYFADRLAPCLRLLGYHPAPAPDRAGYVADVRSGLYWSPYYADPLHPIVSEVADWDRIDLQCPPLPDDPYWAYRPLAWMHTSAEGSGALR
jgi:hypothetical protein